MVDGADLSGVDVAASGAVDGDGVGVPAIPEAEDDVDIFGGNGVALGVVGVELAEVGGGLGAGAGHSIPGGAAAADVVEGG